MGYIYRLDLFDYTLCKTGRSFIRFRKDDCSVAGDYNPVFKMAFDRFRQDFSFYIRAYTG